MRYNKKKILNILSAVCIIVLLIYIYSNSLNNGTQSTSSSNAFVEIVQNIFPTTNTSVVSFIIRKTAHFIEFFVLGLFLNYLIIFNLAKKMLQIACVAICYFFGAIDEFIQTFVEGRNGNLLDTFIDYSGFLMSFILVYLIYRKIRKKGLKKNEN